VADVLGDRLVVGDEQIERSELTLQVAQPKGMPSIV